MESIIIHTETKEQTKAFEQMVKAMDQNYSKENKLTGTKFTKEFKDAHKKGYTIDQARKKVCKWQREIMEGKIIVKPAILRKLNSLLKILHNEKYISDNKANL